MIYYVGKLELEKNKNDDLATKTVTNFMKSIVSKTDSVKVIRQTEMEAASFYEHNGNSQKAYESNIKT